MKNVAWKQKKRLSLILIGEMGEDFMAELTEMPRKSFHCFFLILINF